MALCCVLEALFHFILIVSIIIILQMRKLSQGQIMQLIQHCRANKVLEPDRTENVLTFSFSLQKHAPNTLCYFPFLELICSLLPWGQSSHNCSLCVECPPHKFHSCLDYIYSSVKSLLKYHLFSKSSLTIWNYIIYFFMVWFSSKISKLFTTGS